MVCNGIPKYALNGFFSGNIDSLSTGKCNALKPSETISASCAQTWWLSWQAIITLVHVWCTQRASEDRSPVFWNSLAPTQQNALPLKRSSLTESSESTSFESLNQSEDRIASEALLKMLSELPTPYCSSKPSTVTLLGGIHSKTHSFWISKSLKGAENQTQCCTARNWNGGCPEAMAEWNRCLMVYL